MSNGNSNPKIIDLIKKKENGSKPFVSIEFFPPRTEQGVKVRLCLLCRVPACPCSFALNDAISGRENNFHSDLIMYFYLDVLSRRICTAAWSA